MNNEHWVTRRYTVANHTAGSTHLSYETLVDPVRADLNLCEQFGGDIEYNRYFIDGCVAAFDTPGDMVVAAGGPEVLLASLDAELRPRRVRLTRLTHPM